MKTIETFFAIVGLIVAAYALVMLIVDVIRYFKYFRK